MRNGPFWQDSVIFIAYDEHGGYYDHVASPAARQGHQRTPDSISPGQCADLSNAASSLLPGGGAECSQNLVSKTDTTVIDAGKLCPEFSANPTGPYPDECASFDQLGIRVPFLAVSPFAKSPYVSHTLGDHTSILAFVEKRFLTVSASPADDDGDNDSDDFAPFKRLHLTLRDQSRTCSTSTARPIDSVRVNHLATFPTTRNMGDRKITTQRTDAPPRLRRGFARAN